MGQEERALRRLFRRPSCWPLLEMPTSLIVYVLAVVICDLALTGWELAGTPVRGGDLLLFGRRSAEERVLVTLNLGDEPPTVSFPGRGVDGTVLISSLGDRDGERVTGSIDLRPNEGFVIRLDPGSDIPGTM